MVTMTNDKIKIFDAYKFKNRNHKVVSVVKSNREIVESIELVTK